MPLISLLLGTCWRCEYQAKVGVGWDDNATVPVHWTTSNCPSCGLVPVNVAELTPSMEARCHECDTAVEFLVAEARRPNRGTTSRAPVVAS